MTPLRPSISARTERRIFFALLLAGAIARLAAWRRLPMIHPDEIFQTVEPACWHLGGAGLATWEWATGIRSWVLPTYHGAWIAGLEALGVRDGAVLGGFLQLHWALLDLLLVWAAWRGGACVARAWLRARPGGDAAVVAATPAREPAALGWQGGLLAAALCALFPPIVAAAPHTLSELPSRLCLVLALVLTALLIERPSPGGWRAATIGALLGLGLCIRITNAPLVLVPPLWLLLRRRWGDLERLAVGAFWPVLAFGLVDQLTWGKPFASFAGYLEFNLVKGRAAEVFGGAPATFYLERLHGQAPGVLALVLLPLLLGWRASWPFALSALGLVTALSGEAHKEERFILAFWPLALMGAAGVAGAALAHAGSLGRQPRRAGRALAPAGLLLATVATLATGLAGLGSRDHNFSRAWLAGQARAGADPNLGGLLVESILYSGGSLFFGRPNLQIHFDPALLGSGVITHALVRSGSLNHQLAHAAGFEPVFAADDVVLLRRHDAGP